MNKIIKGLNKIGRDYINDKFAFCPQSPFLYVSISDNLTTAINFRKNDSQQVKVLNWFEDFWLYIETNFKKVHIEIENWDKAKRDGYLKFLDTEFIKINKDYYSIFFTLSIFQGTAEDNTKTQLFRAEWDNHKEQSDKHPQPHWHIYPHKYSTQVHKDFEDFIELTKTDDDFSKVVNNRDQTSDEIVQLDKFHFAMNGQWSENKTDIHRISAESHLTNWFAGVLTHIKKELEYLKVK